jgi:hypothetical protein
VAEVVSADVNPGEVQTLFTASTWSLLTVRRTAGLPPVPFIGFHRTIPPLGDSSAFPVDFFSSVYVLAPGDVVYASSPAGAAGVDMIISPLP